MMTEMYSRDTRPRSSRQFDLWFAIWSFDDFPVRLGSLRCNFLCLRVIVRVIIIVFFVALLFVFT